MNVAIFTFLLVAAGLIFSLPRRRASLPIIMGAAYIGCFLQIEIGPAHFTVSRILVTLGLLRVITKGERIAGGWNALDRVMLFWAAWAVCSSVFHVDGTLVFRLGMVLDTFGVYLLFRVFIQNSKDIINICKLICILFVPLGAAMIFEKLTGKNSFEILGGAPGNAELRNGNFRARGPFIHQILGGTIGAVCMPLALYLWRQERMLALSGFAVTGGIVFASGSSGPIMTALAVFFALALWKIQDRLRTIRWLAVLLIIVLAMVMKDPVYYILARIDITGGSTGWHRAALIDGALNHFGEWWLAGTDYTRSWMPTGIPANQDNTDITNHFLAMGVWGGLPLMLLFVWVLFTAFAAVGRALRLGEHASFEQRFLIWTFGSILFAHITTFMSISYFDQQSSVFFYLLLAAIGSLCLTTLAGAPVAAVENGQDDDERAAETPVNHG